MDSLKTVMQQLFMAKGSDIGPGFVAARVLIVLVVAIFFVRLGKKRFIAQATAMDLVMVVIFGSTLSRGINGGANLLSVLIAGAVIVILHRVLTHFASRSEKFGSLVKGTSEVIVRNGEIDWKQMHLHDISELDLKQEMRVHALVEDLRKIKLAVLERSGEIGFVKAED